jgi:Nif-specific ferredoxin III
MRLCGDRERRKVYMANIVGYTRGGEAWVPKFIESIDIHKCIGCGRCYKACSRDVLELIEKPFEAARHARGHARKSVICI